jgi:hypothetical protein
VEGFRYSPALREAGESGMVWDEETLAGYLADPRGFIRGNRMAFQGLRSEEDIAAVIAYIQAPGPNDMGRGARLASVALILHRPWPRCLGRGRPGTRRGALPALRRLPHDR